MTAQEFVEIDPVCNRMQDDYNHHCPHSSLGNLTPSEFVNSRSVQPNEVTFPWEYRDRSKLGKVCTTPAAA